MPKLQLVILAVEDVDRAVAFYTQAFGWPVRERVPVYAEVAAGEGIGVGLYQQGGFAVNTGAPLQSRGVGTTATELYVRVPDLARATESMLAAGAAVLAPAADKPWGDRAAYFSDPDGNVVVIATTTA